MFKIYNVPFYVDNTARSIGSLIAFKLKLFFELTAYHFLKFVLFLNGSYLRPNVGCIWLKLFVVFHINIICVV